MKTLTGKLAAVHTISVLVLLTGCAGGPRIDIVEPGEMISISSADRAEGDATPVSIGNDAVGNDMAAGAGGGFVAGGAAGMSCGPWAFLCVPFGAVSGAVVGGAGGAIVGSLRGLNGDQRESVAVSVDRYFTDYAPDETLTRRIDSRLSKSWQTTEEPADNRMVVALDRIGIDSQGSGMITLELRVAVTVQGSRNGKPVEIRRTFSYQGLPRSVGLWIEDADGFVESEFDEAYRVIAENIFYAMYGG